LFGQRVSSEFSDAMFPPTNFLPTKIIKRNAAITSAIILVSFIHNRNIRISNCFEFTKLFYASLTP
jgi:type IV secretory pathway component VirB8